MKALSVKQPWAWLLVNGHKDVENRNWNTKFRGQVLIQASQGMDFEDYLSAKEICTAQGIELPHPEELPRGVVVGMVEIYDTVTESNSPWFFGRVGFCVRNARKCVPHELKGRLSFFESDLEKGDLKWKRKTTK